MICCANLNSIALLKRFKGRTIGLKTEVVFPHEACMCGVYVQKYAGTVENNADKSATTWIIYPSFRQGTIVLGNRRLEEKLRRAKVDDARYNKPHE